MFQEIPMEIVVIRHGKPKIDTSGKVGASDFGKWISEYNLAGIDDEHFPPNEALKKAGGCTFTVCSTLPRSKESALILNVESVDMVSHLFRECEMPYATWKYPKFSKSTWSVLFRILQFLGYSSNAESFKTIKNRAEECAAQLVELAKKHESVLFVGHGAINWFIHKHLLRMGWSGPQKAGRKYWEFGVYKNNET